MLNECVTVNALIDPPALRVHDCDPLSLDSCLFLDSNRGSCKANLLTTTCCCFSDYNCKHQSLIKPQTLSHEPAIIFGVTVTNSQEKTKTCSFLFRFLIPELNMKQFGCKLVLCLHPSQQNKLISSLNYPEHQE